MKPEDFRRILIIKMRYIGDVILVTPLIAALKERLPGAQIDVLVNHNTAAILSGHSMIRRVLGFDVEKSRKQPMYIFRLIQGIRRRRYDLVIDLTGSDRAAAVTRFSGAPLRIGYSRLRKLREKLVYTQVIPYHLGSLHTVDYHLKAAEVLHLPVKDRHPSLAVMPASRQAVEQKLSAAGIVPDAPFVVIHPGARRWYKSWPPERYARLGDRIIDERTIPVILSGGPGDQDICRKIELEMIHPPINLSGRLNLTELTALIQKSACLIGNDSAPIHIATAVGTPVIALFGPTLSSAWAPRRPSDTVIAAEYPCRPCGHARSDCPLGEEYCMAGISFDSVWEAVKKALEPLSAAMERM